MTKRKRFTFLCSSLSLALGACAGDEAPETNAEPPEVVTARAELEAAVPEIAPSDLEVTRDRVDDLGMTHVRQQQLVDGIPVIGGEAIVHLDRDGAPTAITDKLVRDVRVDTQPTVTSEDAIERALAATVGAGNETAAPAADLRILREKDGDHLVWQVAIESLPTDSDAWTKPVVLVDAHRGDVLRHWDRVVDVNANGTGNARYAGSVSIKTWFDDAATYYLEDDVRKVAAFDLNNGAAGDPVARWKDNDNNWTADRTSVQAHWALEKTWDYYHQTFSREGIDGNYGPGYVDGKAGQGKLVSGLVHWGSSANNAKWIDPQMIFGDGDGTQFGPLVSLDIIAHEWTHGVTSREAGLGGLDEAPALNEHISDVFGAAAEAWFGGVSTNTWLIGEQAYTPGTSGDALRYMADPALDGRTLDYWRSDLDTYDAHDGAGVGNLAFYLVVNGGDHPRRDTAHVTGVGLDKAQRVWYRALTNYLTSDANYADLRQATLLAATDLYGAGGSTYRALHSAWEAVGVPSVSCPGFPDRRSGSLATGESTILPSGSGFWSADGSVLGFLGHDQADDFDLELWRFNPSTSSWSKVDDAVGPGNNEIVAYSSGAGTQYRWRVKATSGSGAFELGWTP